MRLAASSVALAALLAVSTPVLAAPAAAASAATTTQAEPLRGAPVSELIARVDIPWKRFQLDNGLTVLVHEDRKAPVVAVSVWYNVGSKDEPKGSTGFAHLFEHLMFGGSENSPSSHIQTMNAAGATSLNGTTWFDRTNYFQTVPTPALDYTLYLESDRMGYLLGQVSQEVLDLQRGVVQNEKRQGDNQPYGMTYYATLEALFPEGHPYRHSTIGSMADLDSASMETVRDWFRENYGPNNAVLVLSGDIDEAKARELTEKYFGAIARGPVNTPAAAPVPTLAAPVEQVLHDRVAQTRISRTWAVPGLGDPDSVPLSVGASVLGGLASSRLDNVLVRDEQTASSVSASNQTFQRLGMFSYSAMVKPGADADAVAQRMDAVLADLIANGPTQDEINRVVTRYASQRGGGAPRGGPPPPGGRPPAPGGADPARGSRRRPGHRPGVQRRLPGGGARRPVERHRDRLRPLDHRAGDARGAGVRRRGRGRPRRPAGRPHPDAERHAGRHDDARLQGPGRGAGTSGRQRLRRLVDGPHHRQPVGGDD